MSKGQRGNKEAKKPKKSKNLPAPVKTPGSGESMPTLIPAAPPRARR